MKKNKFQKLIEKNIEKSVKELVESLKPELKDCSKNYLIVKYQDMAKDYIYQTCCKLKKYLPNKKIIFIPSEFEIDSWGKKELNEYIEKLIELKEEIKNDRL